MRDVWPEIERWRRSEKLVAMATVIEVKGSSLRPTSAKMVVSATGDIAGSVSGGCVEGAVFEEVQEVLKTGQPKLLSYGITDAAAWEVGLACGGSIRVFVESLGAAPWINLESQIREILHDQQLAALATIVSGPAAGNKLLLWPDGRQAGDLGALALNRLAADLVPDCWSSDTPGLIAGIAKQTGSEVFIDLLAPQNRLVIIGAVHIAIPLIIIAKAMDFRTIVIDARSAFATRERFPHADELIVAWPADALEKIRLDAGTSVVCLSHDDKLDIPALQVALKSPARYVGILGSRITHNNRLKTLRELGPEEDLLERIHAPIGIDLGARFPEEIALSIMAEIIAMRHGKSHRGTF